MVGAHDPTGEAAGLFPRQLCATVCANICICSNLLVLALHNDGAVAARQVKPHEATWMRQLLCPPDQHPRGAQQVLNFCRVPLLVVVNVAWQAAHLCQWEASVLVGGGVEQARAGGKGRQEGGMVQVARSSPP